jgi:hypothetical protein
MDPSSASNSALQDTDDYLFLDPRQPQQQQSRPGAKPKRMVFGEGIVFVVGGGGYVEYTNLMEWAGRTSNSVGGGKRVTYGATEILDPEEFLGVLAALGDVN